MSERIENFHTRLTLAMYLRHIRATDLCQKTGIPKSAISQYISGEFEPRKDRLNLIAKALKVEPDWLMGFDVPMTCQAKTSSEPDSTKIEDQKLKGRKENMKDILTDEQVEQEISRLTESKYVKLARAEVREKYRRLQYLYQLRNLEKRGKQLEDQGWAPGNYEEDAYSE